MNDTRWTTLCQRLTELEVAVRVKYLDEDTPSDWAPRLFRPVANHLETITVLPTPFVLIEWLEIDAGGADQAGRVESVLRETRAPFTREGALWRGWGHVRPGTAPVFSRSTAVLTGKGEVYGASAGFADNDH